MTRRMNSLPVLSMTTMIPPPLPEGHHHLQCQCPCPHHHCQHQGLEHLHKHQHPEGHHHLHISNASSSVDIKANTSNKMAVDAPSSVKGSFFLFSMFVYSYFYFSATVNTSFANLNAGKYYFFFPLYCNLTVYYYISSTNPKAGQFFFLFPMLYSYSQMLHPLTQKQVSCFFPFLHVVSLQSILTVNISSSGPKAGRFFFFLLFLLYSYCLFIQSIPYPLT